MIITLTGPNSFLVDNELNKLYREFTKNHDVMAIEKLDGEEVSADRLVEAAQSLPFLTTHKLIILRHPSHQTAFAEQLDDTLNNIPDTTTLVIVEPKIDKRSAYFKVLKAKTDFKEFVHLDERGLSTWIVQYALEMSAEITPQNAQYLIQRVGPNQQYLANEIIKLSTYKPVIDRASIEILNTPTPQSTVFELLDAAFTGQSSQLARLYAEQRARKVEPQQIMAMIAWQLHVMALVNEAGERTPQQVAADAKLSPYVVMKTVRLTKNLSRTRLRQLINRAVMLDVRLKSQSINADDALLHFLLTVTS